jgi:hypothetical protein
MKGHGMALEVAFESKEYVAWLYSIYGGCI